MYYTYIPFVLLPLRAPVTVYFLLLFNCTFSFYSLHYTFLCIRLRCGGGKPDKPGADTRRHLLEPIVVFEPQSHVCLWRICSRNVNRTKGEKKKRQNCIAVSLCTHSWRGDISTPRVNGADNGARQSITSKWIVIRVPACDYLPVRRSGMKSKRPFRTIRCVMISRTNEKKKSRDRVQCGDPARWWAGMACAWRVRIIWSAVTRGR